MTQVINLKDLAKEPKVVIVDENDTRHEMIPTTVGDFIETLKMAESLGTDASPADEVEMMIKIILRAFPTLTEKAVRAWPFEYLEMISDTARGQNSELVTQDAEKAEEAEASGNG